MLRDFAAKGPTNASLDLKHDFDGLPNQDWKDIREHGDLSLSCRIYGNRH